METLVDIEQELNNFLTSKGFQKDGDIWSKTIEKSVAQQVIVNGKRIESTQSIKINVTFLGSGSLSNSDGTNKKIIYGVDFNGDTIWIEEIDFLEDVKKILDL